MIDMICNEQVIEQLAEHFGIEFRSTQQLNKFLESIGIIERFGVDWIHTDLGVKYLGYGGKDIRPNRWKPNIVSYIAATYRKDIGYS